MEEGSLTRVEKRELLRVARSAVASRLQGESLDVSSDLEALQQEVGAFVTIHKKGDLRGCIGVFTAEDPLYKTIADMARSAAFKDPRFSPVTADEMELLDFEISVLSPLKEIGGVDEIEIGIDGIYITKGCFRGVLLPQVASEQGWDRETFLSHACLKAGLPPDEWRRGAKIEVFSAQVFGEKEVDN